MNKKILYFLLIADIILIVIISAKIGKDYFLNSSLSKVPVEKINIPRSLPKTPKKKKMAVKKPAPPVKIKAIKKKTNKRKIMFQYRSSVPREVSVMGEFSDWEPIPMTKGKNHTWSAVVEIMPGTYLYCYIVDGRLKPDPNNPNIKILSGNEKRSTLTVKPLQ